MLVPGATFQAPTSKGAAEVGIWFKLAVGFVALWGVASVVVAVIYVHPDVYLPWGWRLLREPVFAGAWAASAVGLIYWFYGAPGSAAWQAGLEAGEWRERQRAGQVQGNVVPMPRRVQS